MAGQIDISVVLPCFNEEGCVERLTNEIIGVLQQVGRPFEILFVNDASQDGTATVLDRLANELAPVRVLHHAINCGESAATATAFRHADGELIVTMDSDEQNDPASIPALLGAMEGHDLVCGVREKREDDWLKRASSKLANGFRNLITGDRVTDAGCTFRAVRRTAVLEVPVFNGMHRFLPTLMRLQGYRVTEVPVRHRPRTTGASKYGIGNRLFRGILDCLVMRWWRRRVVPGQRLRGAKNGGP